MTNHPNRRRVGAEEIRQYLADRYGVSRDAVKTGLEADELEAGLCYGELDTWIVYGPIPSSNEVGWFFAGHSGDIVRDMRTERNTST